ncbi:MAG: radical SAM family heme chaperone HemW [Desulfoplanes sp.]|nr:radical SAM family heme chaperone HemW [Desulfoplanes sp.]MDD4648764.1 radical SAM family heme chaperone HemW [Desulfoplanes sp.]
MLLYIHVPFCRSKCRYCAFASGPFSTEAMHCYVHLLIREMIFWKERIAPRQIETIYFGGGTPSLVAAADLARILDAIFSLFDVHSDAEITLEGNPESANDPAYLQALYSLGVNRLSLGVQSLNPRHLAMLGRIHSPEQAIQTVTRAREAGFQNISLDCIWGIPGQRPDDWFKQIEQFTALHPEHLSCYGLSVEPGTPLERDVDQRLLILPTQDDQARMFLEGTALLTSYGYHQYEISNYALKGYQSQHNSGYWEGREYLGLGPSAVSTVDHKRWQNPLTLTAYETAVHQKTLDGHPQELDPTDLRNEHIMLSLRTSKGLDLRAYEQTYGIPFLGTYQNLIEALHQNNLAHIKEGSLCLTPQGMLVSNSIIADFMDTPTSSKTQ